MVFTDASGRVSDLYAALEPAVKDPIRFRRVAAGDGSPAQEVAR